MSYGAAAAPFIQAPQSTAWVTHVGPDGRPFYYNQTTGQSVWEKPDELKTPGERIIAACPWREHKSQDDKTYYYNTATQETSWEKPADLVEAEQQAAVEDAAIIRKKEENAAIPLPEGSYDQQSSDDDDESQSDQNDDSQQSTELVIYSSGKDGVEAFRKFLRDKNLASYLSWEQAHSIIGGDPRYKQFVNVKQKKQHFSNYRSQKAREERDESRAKINKLREELEVVMMKYAHSPVNIAAIGAATAAQATAITEKILRSTTSFRKAEDIFGTMEEWRRIDEGTRKVAFDNVTRELGRKERELAETNRKKSMRSFTELLRSNEQITYQTTWSDAQQLLSGCPELTTLDLEDALDCYEGHIRSLEREHDDDQDRERRRLRRQQRKNREAFIVLLEELHEQGRLHSMSLWTDLYLTITKDERFSNMLSQSGSTPLDLFKFYVEDLKARYAEDKKVIYEILETTAFEVTTSTSFESFANALAEDKRYLNLDSGNIKQAYTRLTEKALAAEKEQLRQQAKQIQRLESAFQKALRELGEPAVDLDSKWEDVRPRIENKAEFAAIEDEQQREKLFAEYLEILEEVCAHRHSKHKHGSKRRKKSRKGDKRDSSQDSNDSCSSPNTRIGPDEYGASKRLKREKSPDGSVQSSDADEDEESGEEGLEAGEMRESTGKSGKKLKKEKKHRKHHKHRRKSSSRHHKKSSRHRRQGENGEENDDEATRQSDEESAGDGD